jgi:hypothetical protein
MIVKDPWYMPTDRKTNDRLNKPVEKPYANRQGVHFVASEDVQLLRDFYDEALETQGVPVEYQYPLKNDYNVHGEQAADAFSEVIDTFCAVEAEPKISTLKKLGWVVENNSSLPFLLHVSFGLPEIQKGCKFKFAGLHTGLPSREFVVERISMELQVPDHIICEVIPQYRKDGGIAEDQVAKQKLLDKETLFFEEESDYRGDVYDLVDGDW